jgi:hypothetical protein
MITKGCLVRICNYPSAQRRILHGQVFLTISDPYRTSHGPLDIVDILWRGDRVTVFVEDLEKV